MNRFYAMAALPLVGVLCLTMAADAEAGLLGYWDFNDATTPGVAADASGRGNSGTISVATYTADTGGHTGSGGDYALDFGTTNNGARVFLPSAGFGAFRTMTDNNQATASLWINGHASQPGNDTAFDFYNGGDARQFMSHLPWSNQNIYFDVGGCCGGSQRINKAEGDSTKWKGQWNHYAFVKDGNQSQIYQNGTLWHSGTTSAPIGQIVGAFIGSEVNSSNSYGGLIDDYAIWDEALSAGQIADLASGAASPADSVQPAAEGYAVNVAPIYGTATQSSTSSGGVPGRAIDGNANGTWGNGSVSHTADAAGSFWRVDLGSTLPLEYVQLFNRVDCCWDRLSNFRVSVLDDAMAEVYGQDFTGTVDRFFGQAISVPQGTEGRYVQVQLDGIVSLAEARVVARLDELPNYFNVAPDLGFATQSSTRVGTGGNDANFAIDGDTDGNWNNDSVTHTASTTEQNSWWQVDFGEMLHLENVRLYARTGNAGRLGNFRLSVLDTDSNEVYGVDVPGNGGGQNYILPFGVEGSTVRVQLDGVNNEGNGILQLAEAQVFGGPLANLARNPDAVATQSSTRIGSGGNVAEVAVDGDTNGQWGGNSVTHTLDEPNSWWQVDLGQSARLDEVILYNRADCCGGRLSNFHLSVLKDGSETFGEDFFVTSGSVAQGGSLRIDLPDGLSGDTVRIQLLGTGRTGEQVLSLAEVQVYGLVVPEPSSIALWGLGLLALAWHGVRRRKR